MGSDIGQTAICGGIEAFIISASLWDLPHYLPFLFAPTTFLFLDTHNGTVHTASLLIIIVYIQILKCVMQVVREGTRPQKQVVFDGVKAGDLLTAS
jgi:hypothetical protein